MANCSGGDDGGWLGGWLQTVKDKSVSAMEFVKRDLAEYTCTMQTDTRTVAHAVKEGIKEENASTTSAKMKKGLGYILGGITQVLTVPPDDSDEEQVMVGKDSVTVFDKAKVRLRAIQVDPGTYINAPAGPPVEFDEWLATNDLLEKKGHISELLVSNVDVRALYTQLVPSEVSHTLFWQRYFYKLHLLEKDEERRRELKKRAEEAKSETVGWEDDWEDMAAPNSPPKDPESLGAPSAKTDERLPAISPDVLEETNKNMETIPCSVSESKDDVKGSISETDAPDLKNTDSVAAPTPLNVPICDNENVAIPGTEGIGATSESPTMILVEASSGEQDSVTLVEEPLPVLDQAKESVVPRMEEAVLFHPVDDVKHLQPTPVEVKSKLSGDTVIVGRDANTPTDSCGSSNSKESSSLDDDWEKDFDIEVTEEDLKMAQEAAKKISLDTVEKKLEEDEDWENWD
ncbi:BSD domain-containing protein 1-like [Lineus longissimus]|uniref:BSD domain-containing protein 1-like n=1 Tax=Lineus longissimus TaxID=88925 RepID=UPI002B4CCA10